MEETKEVIRKWDGGWLVGGRVRSEGGTEDRVRSGVGTEDRVRSDVATVEDTLDNL